MCGIDEPSEFSGRGVTTRSIDRGVTLRGLLTAVAMFCTAVFAASPATAHPMIPPGLSVAEAHRLLSEARWSDEPEWSLEMWIAMEDALARYRHARAERLDPIGAQLDADYPSQQWFNWPGLREERAFELRDSAIIASIALERELFESLRHAAKHALQRVQPIPTVQTVPPVQQGEPGSPRRPDDAIPSGASADPAAWIEVIDRAERRRRRTAIVPRPSLSGARIADVEWLVRAEIPEALGDPRVQAVLDEWSRDLDGRIEGLWRRHRETKERFRAALVRQGIDPVADIADRARWMPEAFAVWLEVSGGLRQDVAAATAAARVAVERIASIVGSETVHPLLDEWMGQAYVTPIHRFVGPVPEEHEAIVEEWRRLELGSRAESIRRIESLSPARWPLERGGWNHRADEIARRPGLARLAELDAERSEAAGRLARSLGATDRTPVVRQEHLYRLVHWSRAEPLRAIRHRASTVLGGRTTLADSDDWLSLPEFSREELQSLGAALFVDPTDRTIWTAMVEEHLGAVATLGARLGPRGVAPRGFLRRPQIEPRDVTRIFDTESSRTNELSALETRLFEDAALLLDGELAELVEMIGSWRRIDHALHACRNFQSLDYGAVVDARGFANALGPALEPLLEADEIHRAASRVADRSDRTAVLRILRDVVPRLEAVVEERASLVRLRVVEHFIQHAHPDAPDPDHASHATPLARWWIEEMALRDETTALHEALVGSIDELMPGAGVAARWRRAAWPAAHGVDAEVHGRIVKAWSDAASAAAALAGTADAPDAPPGTSTANRARDLEQLLAWFEVQWWAPTESLVTMSREVPPLGMFEVIRGVEQAAEWRARRDQLDAARLIIAESAEVRLMILLGENPTPAAAEPKRVW